MQRLFLISLPRRLFLPLLMAVLFCSVSVATAEAAKVCHLVVIADTNDQKIGQSVDIDQRNVTRVFRENVARNQLSVQTIRGNEVRKSRILSTIQNVNRRMSKEDTLIVYLAGHGAEDRRLGHYFELSSGEKMLRNDVLRSMNSKDVRLKVLITDTCSVFKSLKAAASYAQPQSTSTTSAAFVSLCWKPAGEIDMSACSSGEFSMGDNISGGYFTSQLVNYLDRNRSREVSWGQLFRSVKQSTAQVFRENNPRGVAGPAGGIQRTQTPIARLDMDSGDSGGGSSTGPRFGVRVINSSGRGVLITEVLRGTPGTQVNVAGLSGPVSLEAGDRIVSINGRRIDSESDYARAVDDSGQAMDFEVINKRDGRTYRASVRLTR